MPEVPPEEVLPEEVLPEAFLPEEVLQGGNTSVVVRVGDTVRRQAGHWTPAVHALLAHLASVGFVDAPTVLGMDERGREVLGYVEGEVGVLDPGHLLPLWFRTAEACHAAGDWLRRFHAAQRGFTPDPSLPWRLYAGRPLREGEVIVHHDVAPYNTIRRAGGALTVIDWDFLPQACASQMTRHADHVEAMAQDDPAFARLVDQGIPRDARRDAAWVRKNGALLATGVHR